MKIRTQAKNMTEKEQSIFNDYLEKKIDSIKGLMTNFSEDSVMLEVRIEKFEKHDAFEVEMVLRMPGATIKSKEVSHAITKALDLSKDRLIAQIKKKIDTRKHSAIKEKTIKATTKKVFEFSEVA